MEEMGIREIRANHIEKELSQLLNLTIDQIKYRGYDSNCSLLLRKADFQEPLASIDLINCFMSKDTGIVGEQLVGFKILLPVGSALFDAILSHGKLPESYYEIRFWTNRKNTSAWWGFETTGFTAGCEDIIIKYDKTSFIGQ